MAVRFIFDFAGEAQVDRTLEGLTERALDARPAWAVIMRRLARAEGTQFRTEGAYASGGWAPLSPAYAARKARAYPGKPILERTGRLVRSLTSPTAPDAIRRSEPHLMEFGTSVPYGRYHQTGTRFMPRRRPVELPETERVEVVKVLQRFIVTGTAS